MTIECYGDIYGSHRKKIVAGRSKKMVLLGTLGFSDSKKLVAMKTSPAHIIFSKIVIQDSTRLR